MSDKLLLKSNSKMLLSDRFKLLRQQSLSERATNRRQPMRSNQSANYNNGRQTTAKRIKNRTIQQRLGAPVGQARRRLGAIHPNSQQPRNVPNRVNKRMKINRNNFVGTQKVISTPVHLIRNGARKYDAHTQFKKPRKAFTQTQNGGGQIVNKPNRKMTLKQKQNQRIRQTTFTNSKLTQGGQNVIKGTPARKKKPNVNRKALLQNSKKGIQKLRQPKATKESLDKDLDKYMAKTKSSLDCEIDAYMSTITN